MYAKADRSIVPTVDSPGSAQAGKAGPYGHLCDRTRYRSAVTRHNESQPSHTYYDGGDLSPYSIDSLIDLLRAESRLPYLSLDVELEIAGPCSAAALREVELRFSELSLRGLNLRIRAEGHALFVLETKRRES